MGHGSTEGSPSIIVEKQGDKGLKSGAPSLVSTVVMGVASTAPAYSLAATLGLIVAAVGLGAPIIAFLAFIPMLLTSIGYSELNKADPDCGTTFTWATRAFGPRTGWAGGWAIVAADILVMMSLAQVAAVYLFQLFGAHGIGSQPTSGWVLLTGAGWIVAMTYICYRGIEVSARFQKILLSIEIVMLLLLSVVALVRVGNGHHPSVSITPALSWFNPLQSGFSAFVSGIILMLFIYWGWDTAVAVNEETADRERTPGRAAIISTVILLVTDPDGAQLGGGVHPDDDPPHGADHAVDGDLRRSPEGVRQDAPAVPHAHGVDARDGRHLDPAVHPLQLPGGWLAHPRRGDSDRPVHRLLLRLHRVRVRWYYRKTLTSSARNLWIQGILPVLGGLIMYFAGGWSLWADWDYAANNSYTSWLMPFWPHWYIGGVFLIAFISALVGLIAGIYMRFVSPGFFRKQTLTRATPTLVPDET